MPHVSIKMYPGSSEEKKQELVKQITNSIKSVILKDEDAISISIEEISEKIWMEKVYNLDIKPNLEKLYKKPGY